MTDKIGKLLKSQDFKGLAQLLTAVEKAGPEALKHSELLEPKSQAFHVGITGPPGAGKSTLVGGLLGELKKAGLKVAVLAVDPSSPFTQGAILGDRIRYADHIEDVFVRSIGTRGSLGGLSSSAYLMLRAFDHYGFDIVLIETVGVGQTELEIMNVADFISVVLVPESGDSIQAMKAGLLEIAQLFVVNKADRPGAENLAKELQGQFGSHENPVEVMQSVATQSQGVDELAKYILTAKGAFQPEARRSPHRLQAEARALLRGQFEEELLAKSSGVDSAPSLAALFE